MENKQEHTKKEKKSNKLFIILYIIIGLLVCAIGVLSWLLVNVKQEVVYISVLKENVIAEKNALDIELKDMLVQYEALETTNVQYKEEIEAKKLEIETLIKEAEKHKNDAYVIGKLKKEAASLRSIMKGYIHTIDSLNTLNVNLKAENSEVKTMLDDQKGKYSELEKVRENLAGKVKIGQRLSANGVTAITQTVKSPTTAKETNKAKKTDRIKACFTIEKNEIAIPGKRNVYLRIISPSAVVLPCEEDDCELPKEVGQGPFSLKREFDYRNEELDFCVYYDVQEPLKEGQYIVEILNDEAELGRVTVTLR